MTLKTRRAADAKPQSGWDEIAFPDLGDTDSYALEIEGDKLLPIYRAGDRLIVSPAAKTPRGCRVVVRFKDGAVAARVFLLRGRTTITLAPLAGGERVTMPADTIEAMHRIVWASQ